MYYIEQHIEESFKATLYNEWLASTTISYSTNVYQTFSSLKWNKWFLTMKALDCFSNSPGQWHWKSQGKSRENMYTKFKVE